MATIDYFLKIDGVAGESTDERHRGEIEVQSFSWGEAQQTGAGPGGGGGAGRVQRADFSFVKRLDKSSPVLMIGCATGQHFRTAELTARKAGGAQREFFRITLEEVRISAYSTSGSPDGTAPLTDQVTLSFERLAMGYKEQKPDGSLGEEEIGKFDFAANRRL